MDEPRATLVVRSTGAIATIQRPPDVSNIQQGLVNVNLKFFAKLDNGMLFVDPFTTSVIAMDIVNLGQFHEQITMSARIMRNDDMESLREHQWTRIIDGLQVHFDLTTTANELVELPFDLLVDGELRSLIEEHRT